MDEELSKKLDRLSGLLALNLTKDLEYLEQLRILDRAGFQPKEIQQMLGKSSDSVRSGLYQMRNMKR
jgi:DNA-directed RNA polymerase specialized sigma24 family protein